MKTFVFALSLILLCTGSALAGSIPVVNSLHWQSSVRLASDTVVGVELFNPACTVGPFLTIPMPNGAAWSAYDGEHLGCGVQFTTAAIPPGVDAQWRLTYRDDAGVVRSSYSGAPMGAVSVARPLSGLPVISTGLLSTYVTTFPTETASLLATFTDGTTETWTATAPVHQHKILRPGVQRFRLTVTTPSTAILPCMVSIDDGTGTDSMVTSCP